MTSTDPLAPWTILSSAPAAAFPPWLAVELQHVVTPSGKDIPELVLRTCRDSVCIVAVDERGDCRMVRQRKHAIGRVLLEFPAGYLELGEAPLGCAVRELREETGCIAGEWLYLGAAYREPHYSPTVMHFFLARRLTRLGDPAPDPTEELAAVRVGVQAIPGLIAAGDLPSVYCQAAWALVEPYLREHTSNGNRPAR